MEEDRKVPKKSVGDSMVSPGARLVRSRPSSDNKQYSYDDYDDYSKMVFSREYICSQPSSNRESARAKTPKDDKSELIYKKYTEGVETITERSTEFSMQKLSNCTLSKIHDLKEINRSSDKFWPSFESKMNLADVPRTSTESVQLGIIQEKEISHDSNDLSESIYVPKMDKDTVETPKEEPNYSISGTCSIKSDENIKEHSDISPIKTVDLLPMKINQSGSQKTKTYQKENYQQNDAAEEGSEKSSWKSENFEAPCYIEENSSKKDKWRSGQRALLEEMREQQLYEPDVISIEDDTPGKVSNESLDSSSKPVYQSRLSPAGDDSVLTEWHYYDKINTLSSALTNYTFNSIKSVENIIGEIGKKSGQIESLCHKLGSPELKKMEHMLSEFAKRRSDCNPSTRNRFSLLGLGQLELVDAVWCCNTKMIDKYQATGKGKKNSSSKGPIMNRIVVSHPHILESLTYGNLRTLKPGNWLNDEVINAYLRLVDANLEMSNPSVRLVNTYFLQETISNKLNQTKIMRILSRKRIDVKSLSRLFVPINTNNTHWSFAVIDFDKNSIVYHDSLGKGNISFKNDLLGLASLLQSERNCSPVSFTSISMAQNFPKQENLIDCGAFMLKGIDEMARFGSVTFGQADIDYLRNLVCFELLQGKFYQP